MANSIHFPNRNKLIIFQFVFQLTCSAAFSQVQDIGQNFKKKGFIEQINYQNKVLVVNFVSDDKISTELLAFVPTSHIANNKDFYFLRPGIEIAVDGEYFQSKNYSNINTLEIVTPDKKALKIENGRIDGILNGYAYVDGIRIKSENSSQIAGEKGSGYSNKTFNNLESLKVGDIANVSGVYNNMGYLSISRATIAPDAETDADKHLRELELHNLLYPTWIDASRRDSLFGVNIEGIGRISSSRTLQEYVNSIGLKLVPDYVKGKIKFIFIVIDNDQFNAFCTPSGLSFVYTGLFKYIQNEAQLAAVLGHEITHAVYEHGAAGLVKEKEAKEKKVKLGKIATILKNTEVAVRNSPILNQKLPSVLKQEDIKTDTTLTNTFFKNLPSVILDKKLSDYSISQESQADRVGLYLMAQAGYDPRQAPVIWKNQFNKSGGANETDTTKTSLLQRISVDVTKLRRPTLENVSLTTINSAGTQKIEYLGVRSKKDHPDDIKRFEDLNRLICLYWSDSSFLKTTTAGDENFIKILTKAEGELERGNWNYYFENAKNNETKIKLLDIAIEKGYEPKAAFFKQRGICNDEAGLNSQAIKDFSSAIAIAPNDYGAYLLRGLSKYQYSRKYEDAIKDFTKSISLHKNDENAFLFRGLSYFNLKNYKNALPDFKEVIKQNPNNEQAQKLIERTEEEMKKK